MKHDPRRHDDELLENDRFSGGAGSLRQPLSDEDYKRQLQKLSRSE